MYCPKILATDRDKPFSYLQSKFFVEHLPDKCFCNELVTAAFYIKGATELYFMYYFRVVIILFSTGSYKSAFSTYNFGKTSFSSFCVLVFRVFVTFVFNF